MEDELITILTAVLLTAEIITDKTPAEDIPIFRQGSLGEDEAYPETFFTFWSSSDNEHSAYDNDTALAVSSFDVNCYSTSASTVYSLTAAARSALKAAGWQTPDRGHDVASDEVTHTGRGISVTYLQTL